MFKIYNSTSILPRIFVVLNLIHNKMKLEHIAIWVKDLEAARAFYTKYFNMKSNEKYVNEKKEFSSYFLSFARGEARIEIMHNPKVFDCLVERGFEAGFTHLAFSVGGKKKVDELTDQLRTGGYKVVGEPRTTGDGYYESIVLDLEGNAIEITE